MYIYLLINFFSILIPVIASFDRRLLFFRKWPQIVPAILLPMILFIPWDVVFTQRGVWGFNPAYLTGWYVFDLPIEEWLFFVSIPFACLFTYHSLKYLVKKDIYYQAAPYISGVIILVLAAVAVAYSDRIYTLITFVLAIVYIAFLQFVLRSEFMGRFYFTYQFILIPFFVVNGLLTGSLIEDEVVWYNAAEIIGLRLFTIPVEDSVYGMMLLMMNTAIFEYLDQYKSKTAS